MPLQFLRGELSECWVVLPRFRCISAWVESGCPLRTLPADAGTRARLVGAPNNARSLRSLAGLLLALALESAYEDTLPLLNRSVTALAARRSVRTADSARLETLSH